MYDRASGGMTLLGVLFYAVPMGKGYLCDREVLVRGTQLSGFLGAPSVEWPPQYIEEGVFLVWAWARFSSVSRV